MKIKKSLLRKGSKLTIALALGLGIIGFSTNITNADIATLQVNDSTVLTPEALAQSLVGGSVAISNVKYSGAPRALGNFSGGQSIFGFDNGVVLGTGDVHGIIGPNTTDSYSVANYTPGDSDLNALIPGYTTNDAATLDFDFISNTGYISFNYVFSSEEYNEYVWSKYNDVFGFFLNGQNIALIPNTTTPVSINTVNGGNLDGTIPASNPQYYIDNTIAKGAPLNTQMDGMTVVMKAVAKVNKGAVNHIKLAIGDAGDMMLDSNVMIQAGSFTDDPTNLTITGTTPDFTTTGTQSATGTNYLNVQSAPTISMPVPEVINFDKMTGGGKLAPHNNSLVNSSFGFNIQNTKNGVGVDLEYNDNGKIKVTNDDPKQIHVDGFATNVHQLYDSKGKVNGLVFDAPARLNNKDLVKVNVTVIDNGNPSKDVFLLTIINGKDAGYESGDGTVAEGNIQMH